MFLLSFWRLLSRLWLETAVYTDRKRLKLGVGPFLTGVLLKLLPTLSLYGPTSYALRPLKQHPH